MKEIYLLYSTATNNETRLDAITSDQEKASMWAKHFGNHYESEMLDDLTLVQWAFKKEPDGPLPTIRHRA